MSVIKNNKKRFGGVLLIGLLVVLISTFAISNQAQKASAAGATGIVCTDGPTFNLRATDGYISTPDGNVMYMWGFADMDGENIYQNPGPVLCVNEGDTVTVNLQNDLPENVSIIFRGQTGVSSSGGTLGLFTMEAAPSTTVTYSFEAMHPGTFIYESGTNPHKQVQMGLYGGLVVRPSMGANYAYNDATTEFNPEKEFLLILHDMDPLLHLAVESAEPYDITNIWDRYWTINGRSFPDTVGPNGVPWLPSQPYGAVVHVEPLSASNPLPALIRYANAGFENHPFHPHGNNLTIIGRDGRQLQGAAVENFTTSIGTGQTYDALVVWEDVEAWDPGSNPIPVQIPGLYNRIFKDDASFYSGSPYLGEKDDLFVGTTSYNACGEFYYPWHTHALNEFQNFDEGFGGMATLWRVDPPGGCQ
ncbi:MAG: multicopper oxidase domain-containing protein [Chloroflexi bacterium]|nr:multicopper oxidase domain-containing protein [Chloroflexota bacterium]